MLRCRSGLFFFFFNDTATTEIYTLSLHDALPISILELSATLLRGKRYEWPADARSEEHTSELQSPKDLVCRLLLEKKKKNQYDRQSLNCRTRKRHTRHIGQTT